jgi:hypothetical protein
MIHGHILDRQADGMMTTMRVPPRRRQRSREERKMTRRQLLMTVSLLAPLALALPRRLSAAGSTKATLYKDPQCGCCAEYAKYLGQNGFDLQVVETFDLPSVKREHGVPEALEGCHTTLVEGYVVEGHVPVDIIKRLLAEKPAIKGISLPGMPPGSPGMDGDKAAPFTIYEIGEGAPKVYATE